MTDEVFVYRVETYTRNRGETYTGDPYARLVWAFYETVDEAQEIVAGFKMRGQRAGYTRISLGEALEYATHLAADAALAAEDEREREKVRRAALSVLPVGVVTWNRTRQQVADEIADAVLEAQAHDRS